MGYLFQNIGQLAGFFVNQGENRYPEKPAAPVSEISFESILDSFAGRFKSKLSDMPENGYLNGNVEYVEKTFLNEEELKALIEKQGNIVTLEISSEEISRYLDDSSLPAINKKYGSAVIPADSAGDTIKLAINGSSRSTYRISFNAADIFDKAYLAVDLTDAGGQKTTQLINITKLICLINEYPEPVQTEIEIMPEIDKAKSLNEFRSTFKFDLRNLFGTSDIKPSRSIEGLISVTSSQLSKNTAVSSYNNKESLPKTSIFDTNDPQQGDMSYKASNLEGLFLLNHRTSISLLDLKNQTSLRGNINRHSEGIVVPESLNEIEGAGAGEVRSEKNDNPSALSKISVGSNGVSETLSAKYKYNNGSLDGITDQYELLRNATIKNSPQDIKEMPVKNFENIENIKASIISAIEHGRSTVRMRLHPPDLGTLHIKLQWRAGTLVTEFRVENAKAGEVVSAILPELKASLEEANLKFTDFDVIVNDRGKDFSSAHNPQYQPGSAWNGQDRKGKSPFEDYVSGDTETVNEKTARIGNLGSGSSHKGWIDFKA
ncbi:MAG: flagellar hook-length control protein FliK [Candidatus Zixiibacteriota bacterium]|nr:MAG: flagellar hook-length control protein FliK [candidate division Zixibacteria bacterium]